MFHNLLQWLSFVTEVLARSSQSRLIRPKLVEALTCGDEAVSDDLWEQYQNELGAVIENLPDTHDAHARAQIALILAKARIWLEAKEPVRYVEELIDAHTYAHNMGLEKVAEEISGKLDAPSNGPEYLQAHGCFEEAVAEYVVREQLPGLSNKARGFLNLRLAECYLALLERSPDDPDSLPQLLDGSLQSALSYLDGLPEQGKAQRLLEEAARV